WLGCDVEDLTVVVLTHELAHAYTQLGADIEGRRWAAPLFAKAEIALFHRQPRLSLLHGRLCLRRGLLPTWGRVFLTDRPPVPPTRRALHPSGAIYRYTRKRGVRRRPAAD